MHRLETGRLEALQQLLCAARRSNHQTITLIALDRQALLDPRRQRRAWAANPSVVVGLTPLSGRLRARSSSARRPPRAQRLPCHARRDSAKRKVTTTRVTSRPSPPHQDILPKVYMYTDTPLSLQLHSTLSHPKPLQPSTSQPNQSQPNINPSAPNPTIPSPNQAQSIQNEAFSAPSSPLKPSRTPSPSQYRPAHSSVDPSKTSFKSKPAQLNPHSSPTSTIQLHPLFLVLPGSTQPHSDPTQSNPSLPIPSQLFLVLPSSTQPHSDPTQSNPSLPIPSQLFLVLPSSTQPHSDPTQSNPSLPIPFPAVPSPSQLNSTSFRPYPVKPISPYPLPAVPSPSQLNSTLFRPYPVKPISPYPLPAVPSPSQLNSTSFRPYPVKLIPSQPRPAQPRPEKCRKKGEGRKVHCLCAVVCAVPRHGGDERRGICVMASTMVV
ncbi:uncharacterized protein LOC135115643 [Scylla paramamosain]|uniref:uncharacterized protein LOC135115643 n=1 Tax=Scylla paramamosain TaxID=85552 RepID=UPI0030835707